VIGDRPDAHQLKNYGFPVNQKTRPQLVNQIEQAVRERTLSALPRTLIQELRTFCSAKTLPSPRALEGCNDDRVMAFGLALEMYRQYGHHEHKSQRRPERKRRPYSYPWQRRSAA
jgi:hypothetical protein